MLQNNMIELFIKHKRPYSKYIIILIQLSENTKKLLLSVDNQYGKLMQGQWKNRDQKSW